MLGQVYIGKVIGKQSIEHADKIESLSVVAGKGGKWLGIAQKGQFNIGGTCHVYLADSILPQTPEFAFMEKYHYRVRMVKLKGVASEVLIMPQIIEGSVGDDITEKAGVIKYFKPIPSSMAGIAFGAFPPFIPRTDEPNFQTVPDMVTALQGKKFYSTIKADGASVTIYYKNGHFGCCSRNLELKETENNAIWKLARQYDIETKLKEQHINVALQFEIIGIGIQKNPMGLNRVDLQLFNVYSIDAQKYLCSCLVKKWSTSIGVPMVDILDWDECFEFETEDALRQYAEGVYPISKQQREGVVIRPMNEMAIEGKRLSFKVINLLYGR